MWIRTVVAALTGAGLVLLPGTTVARADHPPTRQPVVLPTLSGGDGTAHAVNNHGTVVGVSRLASGDFHAVVWIDGKIRDLGTLGGRHSSAQDIDDTGRIVGFAEAADRGTHAVAWVDGVIQDLGLRSDILSTAGTAAQGWTAGTYHVSDTFAGRRAFVRHGGATVELDVPSGSSAEAVNASGVVAGTSAWRNYGDPLFRHHQAFVWENGTVRRLGTLGGPGSTPNDINARGHVVGTSETASGDLASFHWNGSRMRKLSSPPGWSPTAQSVNVDDVIVGTAGSIDKALVWDGPRATARTLAAPAGSVGEMALDLNDHGVIVGAATYLTPRYASRPVLWR